MLPSWSRSCPQNLLRRRRHNVSESTPIDAQAPVAPDSVPVGRITSRIAIIVIYFGTLPAYFQMWLNSCAFNPSFDWLVFTDASIDGYRPPQNVKFRSLTLDGFCERMSEALEITVRFDRAYKVCDFRPLFWNFLRDEPETYDFWGHCDLDMIFGNLGAFIGRALLDAYDKLFSVGHLTLYRNSERANLMYRREHPELDWRRILSDPVHRGFDEHIGVSRIWERYGERFFADESLIADIDPNLPGFELVAPRRNFRDQIFFFERGEVFRGYYARGEWNTERFMYIHFQKRKFSEISSDPGMDAFYITPRGFKQKRESIPSREMVRRLNPISALSPSEALYRLRQRVKFATEIRRRNRLTGNARSG